MGVVIGADSRGIYAFGANSDFRIGLAARVDRDHCDLYAHFCTVARSVQHRSVIFRLVGRLEFTNGVLVATCCDGRVLFKRRIAASRLVESNLFRYVALYGDPDFRDLPSLHVPRDWVVVA